MKHSIAILALLLSPLGCAPAAESNVQLYRTGRKMLLTYRLDMRNDGVLGGSSTSLGGKEVKEVWRGSSSEWGEMELPVIVKASDEPDQMTLFMTFRRQRMGNWYKEEKGSKHEETFDSNRPPSGNEQALREHKNRTEEIKSLSFLVQVDNVGKVVEFDASGEQFESVKKELAASKTVPAEKKRLALGHMSGGVYSALDDAAAYLPPADARKNQKWHVRRKYVLPYHAYGFYMLTNGCGYSTEKSQCQVKSLRKTPAGRVMTIEIKGRRVPQNPEGGMPKRVKHLELSGQLRINLDTGEVLKLQLKSIIRPVSADDEIIAGVKFIESVELAPMSE
jgi:hypothetical protein